MSQPGSRQKSVTKVAVALGSNVTSPFGTPLQTVVRALKILQSKHLRLSTQSGYYATPSFPAGSGPDFINAVAVYIVSQNAKVLLQILHDIEAEFNRMRSSRWAPRTLDLDLLAYGDQVLPDAKTQRQWVDLEPGKQQRLAPDQLIVPHPRLQDRAFVLVPWAEIDPNWRHPLSGLSVREMCDALPESEKSAIRRIDP